MKDSKADNSTLMVLSLQATTPRAWLEPMPWEPLRWQTATMKKIARWPANMCSGSGMSSPQQANGGTMSAWCISSPCFMSLAILLYSQIINE